MAVNLAAMHRQTCRRLGDRPCLRHKAEGTYRDLSWAAAREQADRVAAGLLGVGIAPGDRIGMLSPNRHEWILADQAILSIGAVNVPMHAPLVPPQVVYQLRHSDARAVFVSDQAQADKVLDGLDEVPDLELMISFDPVVAGGRLRTIGWSELAATGSAAGEAGTRAVLELEAKVTGQDLATIMYTSGTTGRPKGVMLTHSNLLSNAEACLHESLVREGDTLLSWLPYSHIYARLCDLYLTAMVGVTVALAESVDTVVQNLAEIQPSWMTSVPRLYEKLWSAVESLPSQERAARLRAILGPNLKMLSSGGAALPRHVGEGFRDAGILVLQGYGLTETSPVIASNRPSSNRVGTVGPALPDIEIRIAPDGEILTRGPHVMKGYWKDPEATSATIVDGWLHTGDVGMLEDDGHLIITDRKKDLIITSGGKNIAPTEVERILVSDPYIDQAVA